MSVEDFIYEKDVFAQIYMKTCFGFIISEVLSPPPSPPKNLIVKAKYIIGITYIVTHIVSASVGFILSGIVCFVATWKLAYSSGLYYR